MKRVAAGGCTSSLPFIEITFVLGVEACSGRSGRLLRIRSEMFVLTLLKFSSSSTTQSSV